MSGLSHERHASVPIQDEDTVLTVVRNKPKNGKKMRRRRLKGNKYLEVLEEVIAVTVAVFVVCFSLVSLIPSRTVMPSLPQGSPTPYTGAPTSQTPYTTTPSFEDTTTAGPTITSITTNTKMTTTMTPTAPSPYTTTPSSEDTTTTGATITTGTTSSMMTTTQAGTATKTASGCPKPSWIKKKFFFS